MWLDKAQTWQLAKELGGEDLVVYRDRSGVPGLLEPRYDQPLAGLPRVRA